MAELLLVSQFAAGACFLALAAGLLAIRFNSRINRAFAIYLLLQGSAILVLAGARMYADRPLAEVLLSFLPHLVLPMPFVLLYFLVLYSAPTATRAVRVAGAASVLAIIAANGAYLADACTLYCATDAGLRAGPLAPLFHATPLTLAMVALWLARRAGSQGERGPAMRVVATAMAMLAFVEGSLIFAGLLKDGNLAWTAGFVSNGWIVAQRLAALAAFVVAATAFFLLGWTGHRGRTLAIASLALLTALVVNANGLRAEGGASPTSSQLLIGIWRLAAAALIAYALARHRFLAIDEKLNLAVRKGTVVTALVATFIVVFQVVENVLDEQLGWIFGGFATGVMLLAARPLERLGQKVARVVVPRSEIRAAPEESRIALFREQAYMVWSDGVMGRKERLLLDNLRERLLIPADVAAKLETDAARLAPADAEPSRLSTA